MDTQAPQPITKPDIIAMLSNFQAQQNDFAIKQSKSLFRAFKYTLRKAKQSILDTVNDQAPYTSANTQFSFAAAQASNKKRPADSAVSQDDSEDEFDIFFDDKI